MQQLRWIFGLTGLATLAIVGLQAYIWSQGFQQGRERFRVSLHRAVEEAAEEFMRPLETHITLADPAVNNSFALRSPGLIAIQIGSVDTTFHFVPAEMDTLKGKVAFFDMSVMHQGARVVKDTTMLIKDDRNLPEALTDRIFIRQQAPCATCATGFSQLSGENFKPLLARELSLLDIDSDFQWGVQHMGHWLITEGDTALLRKSDWHFPFFTFPVGSVEHTLEMNASASHEASLARFSPPVISLYFPSENWQLMRSIGPTLLSSTLLGFLVLGCIGYALHVIMRQKQLSEIKTDFINNMTHEFKTPISTIALACEALQDGNVDIPPASRQQYLKMIATENDRLANQVEKVLQMALLDKKDLDLKMERVNVHLLLREIVAAFSLQLRQRNGTITTKLDASEDVVEGDLMHLRQMFTNLLDNANKYSPDRPDISIETRTKDAGIEIAVHDRGLGISRDALRKIFDRFYRVPTGNRHDVKGFGLGLSYVQTMAMAHGGHVRVTSKPGAGSSFYLYLPYPNV